MRKTLLFILFLLFYTYGRATIQEGDRLIYNGDTVTVFPFILERYIESSPEKELIYSRIKDSFVRNTACWRGFVTWLEIRNDSLFLQKIQGEENIDPALIFGKSNSVFMDWYSGTLTTPKNCLIYDYSATLGGYYEYETDLFIENGVLKGKEKFHNTIVLSPYRKSIDTFKSFIKSNIDYSRVEPVTQKIKIIVTIKGTDENGKITDVSVTKGREGYSEEAIRVIKSVPQWEVIIRRGVKIHRLYAIPVVFEPQE